MTMMATNVMVDDHDNSMNKRESRRRVRKRCSHPCCCCWSVYIFLLSMLLLQTTSTSTTDNNAYTAVLLHTVAGAFTTVRTIHKKVSHLATCESKIRRKSLLCDRRRRVFLAKVDSDDDKITCISSDEQEHEEGEEDLVALVDLELQMKDVDGALPALDIVLENARRRSAPMLAVYRIQAFLDGPIIAPSSNSRPKSTVVNFTRGDAVLVILALTTVHETGFAFGWIIGKVTMNILLKELASKIPASVVILIQPFWPVVWAIIFDQIVLL